MSLSILHVLDHSTPTVSGYSVRSGTLIAAQKQLGFKVKAVTGPLHQLDDASARDITHDGIEYVRTPISGPVSSRALRNRYPGLREWAVVRLLRKRITQLLDTGQYDIVHAHSPALCGLAALSAARSRNLPCVYEIRAFWEDAAVDQNRLSTKSPRYHLIRGLEGFVANRANAVVGIADHILRDLAGRGVAKDKLFHIPNGVNARRFVPQVRDEALAAHLGLGAEPVLGFIGTMYRYEGISWLVRAAVELRRRGNRFKLLIVGAGEDLSQVRETIRELKAEDFVLTTGLVPYSDVLKYYSVMDIMVYPRLSIRLTELVTPLKPLEAMSQEKPVLATNIGGMRELMDDARSALLFAPANVDDFCRQAEHLLHDAGLQKQLGRQAREKVLGEKDWQVIAKRYQDVYAFARSRPLELLSRPSHEPESVASTEMMSAK